MPIEVEGDESMPTTFNPGNRPNQPLYPDSLVYSSVDKVVQYLQLPETEPIALATNTSVSSSSIRLPISGADYRRWGFATGDVVYVYDDVTSLSVSYTLTGATSAGSSGVVNLTAANDGETFTTANNAFLQPASIISNSKQRGITKSAVENLIKKRQDYIDTVTRQSWRPRLVIDEYKNFTTFKPYRRRYYTDYVGAVYLNHRSLRQILRMGVWQGDYYKELAAGRVRLTLTDTHLMTDSDKVFVCPNVAHVGTLQACSAGATSTSKYIRDFGVKSVATELANLINEDVLTNKLPIQIGSLSQNGTDLNISNEYLATANSDDGDGKVIISSMREGEDGINSTIAVSNSSCFAMDRGTQCSSTVTSTTQSNGAVNTFTVSDASTFVQGHSLVYNGNHVALCSRNGNVFTIITDLTSSFASNCSNDVVIYQQRFSIDAADIERQKDWWSIEENGAIMFNNQYPFFENHSIKVSYIYGERYVDKVIEDACTKLVVRDILMTDDYTALFPEGTQNLDLNGKITKIDEEVKRMLIPYQETIIVAGVGG